MRHANYEGFRVEISIQKERVLLNAPLVSTYRCFRTIHAAGFSFSPPPFFSKSRGSKDVDAHHVHYLGNWLIVVTSIWDKVALPSMNISIFQVSLVINVGRRPRLWSRYVHIQVPDRSAMEGYNFLQRLTCI